MTELSEPAGGRFTPPVLVDAAAPGSVSLSPRPFTGAPMPPKQQIYFYSPDEWEEFISEWATGLDEQYVQIKRFGGANDRGADVAAFKTADGFDGAWDCFQGKHYAKALTLGNALPEILKVLHHAAAGHYTLPDAYRFLAPKGCGSGLNKLLSSPARLKDEFRAHMDPGDRLVRDLSSADLIAVSALADSIDFSMFRSVELAEALDVHSTTRYHAARFGGQMPDRAIPGQAPPATIAQAETRYVEQLVDVYSEKRPDRAFVASTVGEDPEFGKHFLRQRIRFYQAESLRLYARDSVPEGTFEMLQDDIHSGVVDVVEAEHTTGYARLNQVLTLVGQLDLSAHALISVSSMDDRKGICHQLANEDQLVWIAGS